MEFMRIGAHVSIAGSLDLAIDQAVEIGDASLKRE